MFVWIECLNPYGCDSNSGNCWVLRKNTFSLVCVFQGASLLSYKLVEPPPIPIHKFLWFEDFPFLLFLSPVLFSWRHGLSPILHRSTSHCLHARRLSCALSMNNKSLLCCNEFYSVSNTVTHLVSSLSELCPQNTWPQPPLFWEVLGIEPRDASVLATTLSRELHTNQVFFLLFILRQSR